MASRREIGQEIMQHGSRPTCREPFEAKRQQAMDHVEIGALVSWLRSEKNASG